MREANEDQKVVSERPEWNAPVMTQFAAEDAETNNTGANADGVLQVS